MSSFSKLNNTQYKVEYETTPAIASGASVSVEDYEKMHEKILEISNSTT